MALLFVSIDGVEYEVLADGAEQSESTYIGQRKRAFDGTLRSSERDEKREWKFNLLFMTNADLQTLRNNIALGAVVSCGGPLMGVTLDCMVRITSAPFTPKNDVDFERGCQVTITEV
jgi:hypothetical protein